MVKYDKWNPARASETERRLSLGAQICSHGDLEMASGKYL